MIKVEQLTKKYKKTIAVDGLNFEIHPGVVTGFLGPNGAGKSTTMRMILNLDHPTNGRVHINGEPYHELTSPIRKVGALIDPNAVHPKRTAYQHLKILATTAGIPAKRIEDVLTMVGISQAAHTPVGHFSLGMQQRLGIATALLGDPETVIFDEPFNGLDPEGIQWLRKLTKDLAADGKSVFISSHLMSEVQEVADRVIIIGRGCLIADMDMEEMAAKSLGNYVRIVSPHIDQLQHLLEEAGASVTLDGEHILNVRQLKIEQIGEIAAKNEITLHELSMYKPTLEQLFIELTGDKALYRASDRSQKGSEASVSATN